MQIAVSLLDRHRLVGSRCRASFVYASGVACAAQNDETDDGEFQKARSVQGSAIRNSAQARPRPANGPSRGMPLI